MMSLGHPCPPVLLVVASCGNNPIYDGVRAPNLKWLEVAHDKTGPNVQSAINPAFQSCDLMRGAVAPRAILSCVGKITLCIITIRHLKEGQIFQVCFA